MKYSARSAALSVGAAALALLALIVPSEGQSVTQNVTLAAGWNAVWLEVAPTYPSGDPKAGQAKAPEDVFTDATIDIVASPKPLAGSSEFFASEPGALTDVTTFNQDEWQQWKRVDVVGTNNLPAIFGNRPYLVHTTGTSTVNVAVAGQVRFFRPKWTPDRYNLLGFGLEGSRTFSDFFSASGSTHPVDQIFTLNPSGAWVKVSSGQVMVSDRAYWIFSSGPSTYMGPVAVDYDRSTTGVFNFAGPGDAVKVGTDSLDLKELTFSNYGSVTATPSVTATSADATLTLYRVLPASDTFGYQRGNGFLAAFTPLLSLQSTSFTIGAKRTFTDDAVHLSLYRIKTSAAGASVYFPVTAVKSEVSQQSLSAGVPPTSVTGLWVGDVVVSAATSIVVNGAPTQPTSSVAPLRIILHSDSAGTVRLLSQVTMMQTKTADPEVSGTPVLILDPAKVPYFEGIKTRNGKKVGVRIEAISYDMPRKASAWGGADLVTFATRPTTLQEDYELSKTMSGAIGATVTGSVSLDPFHRSNPLRHVYHQDLPKGPAISRTFTLTFSPDASIPDRLTGVYAETIQGLIKDTLNLSGTFELRRVSSVGTLDGQ